MLMGMWQVACLGIKVADERFPCSFLCGDPVLATYAGAITVVLGTTGLNSCMTRCRGSHYTYMHDVIHIVVQALKESHVQPSTMYSSYSGYQLSPAKFLQTKRHKTMPVITALRSQLPSNKQYSTVSISPPLVYTSHL